MERDEYVDQRRKGVINADTYYQYYRDHEDNPMNRDTFMQVFPLFTFRHPERTNEIINNVLGYLDSKFNIVLLIHNDIIIDVK